jgi:formylglycine-generating enzyme required for sulfatase activity
MVLIPAGKFKASARRGQGARAEPATEDAEITEPFYMDECEVSNDDYDRFARDTGYLTFAERTPDLRITLGPRGLTLAEDEQPTWRNPFPLLGKSASWPREPVVFLTVEDALAYADWAGATLPTEVQWERAARPSGSEGPYAWGEAKWPEPGAENLAGQEFRERFSAHMSYNVELPYRDPYTVLGPVCSGHPNAWGVRDIIGNASEICLIPEETAAPPVHYALRGRGWHGGNKGVATRQVRTVSFDPDVVGGFRLVRSIATP